MAQRAKPPREREDVTANEKNASRRSGAVANSDINDETMDGRLCRLLHRRADRVELVVQERASRIVHDRDDRERNAGGNQTILDGGGCIFIGKEGPEQSHHQLLFIRPT
jgi:hypothetical protein